MYPYASFESKIAIYNWQVKKEKVAHKFEVKISEDIGAKLPKILEIIITSELNVAKSMPELLKNCKMHAKGTEIAQNCEKIAKNLYEFVHNDK